MKRTRLLLLMLISTSLVMLAACIPSRVKELNTLGNKAVAARQYDKAISYFSESLAIHPDQPKVRLQLDSSKVMLKQVYVFKIYDLVDGPFQPVGTFLNVWRMSADLPKLNVAPARVASIRIDLDKHFTKVEPSLRTKTEHHSYYLHLSQMERLVQSQPVGQARGEVAGLLQGQHLEARRKADSTRLQGLALLHTAAAATFAPGDTGLWAEVTRRRKALLNKLGIRVSLSAQGAPGGSSSHYLLGGVKRRLPRIFIVGPAAPLSLSLQARRPQSDQREVGDRRSAKCQVGTKREPNPECDSLKRRAEMSRRTYEQKLAALQTAQNRCSSEQQASSCTSYLSSANRDVSSAKRDYEDLEQRVGRCPPYVDKPIFKFFFYERRTISRSASVSGTVTVSRGGQVWRSRAVVGSAQASDTYGPGLGCARIPADPLSLASLSTLRVKAEEQMLSNSLHELYQLRRELANKQLAGGNTRDQRLDALVRARLVDESYKRVAQLLQQNLAGMWASDFGLTTRIVQ